MPRAALLLPFLPLLAHASPLVTEAERSGFKRTGRYDEVERLCNAAASADPRRVRCSTFGRTPEGRPMLAISVSGDGVLDPAAARKRNRPVLLIQGGIHAGEIEGKDAIFWILRELVEGKAPTAFTAVLVPVFNVDGHERFAPGNRPNQRGPEEMGWRATAQNFNLNRDYIKADAPEMLAMLALLEAWDPTVYVDLHTTDGAKFEHDVSVQLAPDFDRGDGLAKVARALSDRLQERLAAGGKHLPLPFYPDFRRNDDPASGFENEDTPPRYSEHYAAARNRLGILVETHSWKTYRERVVATHDVLAALFDEAARDAAAWRAAEAAADDRNRRLAGSDVVLTIESDGTPRMIDFRGYAYRTALRSEISGKDWIEYDETRPQIWHVPVYDHMRPKLTVRAPGAGYVVPVAWAPIVEPKLRVHGLRYQTLDKPLSGLAAQGFHVDAMSFDKPFEGHVPLAVSGGWRPLRRDLRAGALFVPIDQPRALLVMHLFEPEAPDSLVSWGYFNTAFERKEYMDGYVLEEEARKMLAADAKLKAEFERRLREDPTFEASPERRLEFFYRRHPAWDTAREWAPILRVDAPPR